MTTGIKWVRAITLDSEIRADWEKWVSDRIASLHRANSVESDPVAIRWNQGRLQQLDEIVRFIEMTVEAYRGADEPNGA